MSERLLSSSVAVMLLLDLCFDVVQLNQIHVLVTHKSQSGPAPVVCWICLVFREIYIYNKYICIPAQSQNRPSTTPNLSFSGLWHQSLLTHLSTVYDISQTTISITSIKPIERERQGHPRTTNKFLDQCACFYDAHWHVFMDKQLSVGQGRPFSSWVDPFSFQYICPCNVLIKNMCCFCRHSSNISLCLFQIQGPTCMLLAYKGIHACTNTQK